MTEAILNVYLNGRFIPQDQACVPITDRGLQFGDSVYEVVPAYGGAPFRLEQHLARAAEAASPMPSPAGIGVPEGRRATLSALRW